MLSTLAELIISRSGSSYLKRYGGVPPVCVLEGPVVISLVKRNHYKLVK